jgi:hypothetical protein
MSDDERRAAEWDCQQLLNKMIHLLDNGRWDELAECFTEDAEFYRPSDPVNAVVGRAAIHKAFSGRPPSITSHQLASCWFQDYTGTELRAQSRILLMAGAASEERPAPANAKAFIGEFVDDFRKVDGQWLLARRKGRIDLAFGS